MEGKGEPFRGRLVHLTRGEAHHREARHKAAELEAHHRAARWDGVYRVVQDKGQQDWQILYEPDADRIRCPLRPYRHRLKSEDDGVQRQPQEEHN